MYLSDSVKRAVVVKDDDLFTKQELYTHQKEVSEATLDEFKIWLTNNCFKERLLKDAQNLMTSRYVAKWKWATDTKGDRKRVILMRLTLRGCKDIFKNEIEKFVLSYSRMENIRVWFNNKGG